MNHTNHSQLNQWEKSDRILMEDFNRDNARIDAALSTIPRIAAGTYTGTFPTNTRDDYITQEIHLGFRPKAVLILCDVSSMESNTLLTEDAPLYASGYLVGKVTADGFLAGSRADNINPRFPSLNLAETTYRYLAIG